MDKQEAQQRRELLIAELESHADYVRLLVERIKTVEYLERLEQQAVAVAAVRDDS